MICGPTRIPSVIFGSDDGANYLHRYFKQSHSLFKTLQEFLIDPNLLQSGGHRTFLGSTQLPCSIISVPGSS